MSHIHSSSGCACCSAMGVKFDYAKPAEQPEVASQRVTTQGLEHIYLAGEPVQIEVVESSIVLESETSIATGDSDLQTVISQQLEQIDEQTRRLEAASYRIGYLEAQLGAKDEQLKLLTTSTTVSSDGWWQSVCQWFK